MVIVGYKEKSRRDVEEGGDGYRWPALSRKAYWEFQGHHTNQAYAGKSLILERGLHFSDDCVISVPLFRQVD